MDRNDARGGFEMATPMPRPLLSTVDAGVLGYSDIWSVPCSSSHLVLERGMGGVGGYGGYRVTGLLSGIGGGMKVSEGCLLSS